MPVEDDENEEVDSVNSVRGNQTKKRTGSKEDNINFMYKNADLMPLYDPTPAQVNDGWIKHISEDKIKKKSNKLELL